MKKKKGRKKKRPKIDSLGCEIKIKIWHWNFHMKKPMKIYL